jgi:hypothetical protein
MFLKLHGICCARLVFHVNNFGNYPKINSIHSNNNNDIDKIENKIKNSPDRAYQKAWHMHGPAIL